MSVTRQGAVMIPLIQTNDKAGTRQGSAAAHPIKVLVLEDQPDDAELMMAQLGIRRLPDRLAARRDGKGIS